MKNREKLRSFERMPFVCKLVSLRCRPQQRVSAGVYRLYTVGYKLVGSKLPSCGIDEGSSLQLSKLLQLTYCIIYKDSQFITSACKYFFISDDPACDNINMHGMVFLQIRFFKWEWCMFLQIFSLLCFLLSNPHLKANLRFECKPRFSTAACHTFILLHYNRQ